MVYFGEQMEISIKKEDLQKCSLFVATPMYGGMNHGLYAKACLDLQGACIQYGINVKFSYLFNESLITRARNYLVDEFLNRSDCTHLLFLDSDIHFNPQDVIAMLALNKDVIGAPYPKKTIKWRSVQAALKKNPDLDAGTLDRITGDYVFNPVKGTQQFAVTEPLEVLEIGTGFMMVRREVFSKWESAYPEYHYKPDHVGQANFDGTRYIHAFFDTVIDSKQGNIKAEVHQFLKKNPDATKEEIVSFIDGPESALGYSYSDRYLSEDYMFCQWWRKMGGKIWLCPWMRTDHIGTYHFKGDMPAVANFVGEM
jgi:hypothetical protein